MPKVSFILPAYKRSFLKEAIDSILTQTCREFELVIVDDKSPEGLYEVIKGYPWESDVEVLSGGGKKWEVEGITVRYYQNENNLGAKDLVSAWNKAVAYAKGEWCILASDDDIYLPDYLEKMLLLAKKYPMVDLVHCRIAMINCSGKLELIGAPRCEYETGVEMACNTIVNRIEIRAPDVMFKRKAWDRIGGFINFPRAWFTDTATWCAIAAENGAACSSEILFHWRLSNLNISTIHTDVYEKTIAGLRFLKWARAHIETIRPKDKVDSYFAEKLRTGVEIATYRIIRYVAANAPIGKWFGTVLTCPMPFKLRLSLILSRVRVFTMRACKKL